MLSEGQQQGLLGLWAMDTSSETNMAETETWILLASSGLLLIGAFANLFSVAVVRNGAKADVNHHHKAYVRHTNYVQHASDAFLNLLTIPLIHLKDTLLASHIQAIPVAAVVWMHVLRSVSRTALLTETFVCFKLTSVYRKSMVGLVYASTFLVVLYAIIFNFIIFFDIFHNFRNTASLMLAVQGWIVPGAILLISNVAYLVAVWRNARENMRTGLVARYGWKLWIAAYGFLIALLFISTTAGSILAHPVHQKLLLLEDKSKILASLLLPTLLSLLNPLLQAICLEKFRRDCIDLLNLWQSGCGL